jgi:hypothetical protein
MQFSFNSSDANLCCRHSDRNEKNTSLPGELMQAASDHSALNSGTRHCLSRFSPNENLLTENALQIMLQLPAISDNV